MQQINKMKVYLQTGIFLKHLLYAEEIFTFKSQTNNGHGRMKSLVITNFVHDVEPSLSFRHHAIVFRSEEAPKISGFPYLSKSSTKLHGR